MCMVRRPVLSPMSIETCHNYYASLTNFASPRFVVHTQPITYKTTICMCRVYSTVSSSHELASFPARVFSILMLGQKQGLVPIAWVIVHMHFKLPKI